MNVDSSWKIIQMIRNDSSLNEFQKRSIIEAISNPNLQWNEDEFLSHLPPNDAIALMEHFPYPVPKHLFAFLTDMLLEKKVNSLERKPRYHDTVLSYFSTLRKLEHYSIENRYKAVLDSISDLWVNSDKNPSIFRTSKDFEPILQRIPNYRDHFIHSFNVFLLGYYIINELGVTRHNEYFKSHDVNLTWMLTATFHDIAYPLQQMESWLNEILDTFLGVNPDFQLKISEIIPPVYVDFMRLISRQHKQPIQGPIEAETFRSMDWTFYNELNSNLVKKDHGVLGALMLAHLLAIREGFAGESQSWNFLYNHLPACHAIGLHHLSAVTASFALHPFAFLLVLCDELQDWGRPSKQTNRRPLHLEDVHISESDRPKIEFAVKASEDKEKELRNALIPRLRTGGRIDVSIRKIDNEEILSIGR